MAVENERRSQVSTFKDTSSDGSRKEDGFKSPMERERMVTIQSNSSQDEGEYGGEGQRQSTMTGHGKS